MYIIIVGAGEVGTYLAKILIREKHDVAIIESDEQVARELEATMDALVIHGNGVTREGFKQAGLAKADLVLAVTAVDEVNLIACMTATKYGKNPQTVARVRQLDYLLGKDSISAEELGLSLLVGPEHAVAKSVVSLLSYEGSGQIHYLANNEVVLLELPLSSDSPLVHDTLAELAIIFPQPSLVTAIGSPKGLLIPTN